MFELGTTYVNIVTYADQKLLARLKFADRQTDRPKTTRKDHFIL